MKLTIAFLFVISTIAVLAIINSIKCRKIYERYIFLIEKAEQIRVIYRDKTFQELILEDENLNKVINEFKESTKANTININTEVIIEKNLDLSLANLESKVENGGSVVIAWGLLGTFTGLIYAISQASIAMKGSASSMIAFSESMQGPIAGMSVAFMTTIAGVVASLLINRSVRKMKLKKDNFYNLMEDYLDNHIFTYYHRTDMENLGEKFEKSFEKMVGSVENNMKTLVEEMSNLFGNGIEKLVNKINDSNIDLKDSVDSLSRYSNELKRLTLNLNKSIENFREPVDTFRVSVEDYVNQNEVFIEKLNKGINKFSNELESASEDFSTLKDTIYRNREEVKGIKDLLHEEFTQLDKTSKNLEYTIGKLRIVSENQGEVITNQLDKLNDSYKAFEYISANFKEMMKEVQENSAIAAQRTITKGIETLSKEVAKSIEAPLGHIENTTDNLIAVSNNLSAFNAATNEYMVSMRKTKVKSENIVELDL